jgi:hypothetical protein
VILHGWDLCHRSRHQNSWHTVLIVMISIQIHPFTFLSVFNPTVFLLRHGVNSCEIPFRSTERHGFSDCKWQNEWRQQSSISHFVADIEPEKTFTLSWQNNVDSLSVVLCCNGGNIRKSDDGNRDELLDSKHNVSSDKVWMFHVLHSQHTWQPRAASVSNRWSAWAALLASEQAWGRKHSMQMNYYHIRER